MDRPPGRPIGVGEFGGALSGAPEGGVGDDTMAILVIRGERHYLFIRMDALDRC